MNQKKCECCGGWFATPAYGWNCCSVQCLRLQHKPRTKEKSLIKTLTAVFSGKINHEGLRNGGL